MKSLTLSLKPCPKCGNKHLVIVSHSAKRYVGPFAVYCNHCRSFSRNCNFKRDAVIFWNNFERSF